MTTYYLAEHVYTCFTNGHIVFLDIKNDRYSALPREVSKILSQLVAKRAVSIDELAGEPQEIQNAITNLISRSMLQTLTPQKVQARSPSIDRPRRDLSEANIEGRRNIPFRHTANFLYAYCKALLGTKIFGIGWLLRDLSHPRNRGRFIEQKGCMLTELMEAFRFIRVFFYKEIDHCYFDCAVHMYFLRRYGFAPAWIFGIKMEPFHAHCWVQVGDVVITSRLTETVMLRPILVV